MLFLISAVNYERMIKDREDIIVQLQHENEHQKSVFKRTIHEREQREHQIQEKLSNVTSELAELQNEVMKLSES